MGPPIHTDVEAPHESHVGTEIQDHGLSVVVDPHARPLYGRCANGADEIGDRRYFDAGRRGEDVKKLSLKFDACRNRVGGNRAGTGEKRRGVPQPCCEGQSPPASDGLQDIAPRGGPIPKVGVTARPVGATSLLSPKQTPRPHRISHRSVPLSSDEGKATPLPSSNDGDRGLLAERECTGQPRRLTSSGRRILGGQHKKAEPGRAPQKCGGRAGNASQKESVELSMWAR